MSNQKSVIDWTLKLDMDKNGLRQVYQEFANLKTTIDGLLSSPDVNFGQALTKSLTDSQDSTKKTINLTKQELQSLKSEISAMETVLNKSFNKNLGTLNISTFNNEIEKSKINLQDFYKKLSSPEIGQAGPQVFRKLTSEVLGTNIQLKKTSEFIDNLMVSFGNTVKWGITSSIFNNVTNAIQGAWTYAKKLDTSLNDIRIVTGKSGDEMERFAREANKAAASLGKSTTDYTQASLIYYQQGLNEEDVKARTDTTLKAASVTGQSTSAVSEQLTAVWSGYKVSAQETELYVDKLAAVAAATASDLEELSTGMSKVASAANIMGVDIDQLSAQIATIISVTRQAPESVGTALKTIYARMGDIEAGIDTETTLGEYTSKMAEMGVNVLNTKGELRDMGEVIEEIGEKWSSMSREQQLSLSQAMAGTRQYNNLLALFDNWGEYTKTLQISANAMGTLQDQQDIYMESTAAHVEQLETAWEKVFDAFFNNEGMNNLIDGGTEFIKLLGNFIESVGGGANVLIGATGTLLDLYKGPLANELMNILDYFQAIQQNQSTIIQQQKVLQSIKDISGVNLENLTDEATKEIIKMKEEMLGFGKIVSEEEHQEVNYLIKLRARLEEQKEGLEEKTQAAKEYLKMIAQLELFTEDPPVKIKTNEQGEKIETLNEEQGQAILKSIFSDTFFDSGATENFFNKYYSQLDKYLKELDQFANNKEGKQKREEFEEKLLRVQEKIAEIESDALTAMSDLESAGLLEYLTENKAMYNEAISLLEEFTAEDGTSPSLFSKIDAYRNALGKGAKEEARQELEEVAEVYRKFLQIYENVYGKMKEKAKEHYDFLKTEGDKAKQQVKQNVEEVKDEYEKLYNQIDQRKLYSEIIRIVGGLGQVASALSGISNIFKTLQDDSLSAGEKALQTITALAYTLPVLKRGWETVSEGVVSLGVQYKLVEAGAEKAFATTIKKGLASKIAIGGLTITLGKLLLIIAAIVAAGYAVYKMWNAHHQAAEEAANAAKDLSKAYEDAKTAAEELKKSISDYGDAKDKLQELGRSTQEYKEALEAANKEARELIETHNLLKDTDYKYKNGLIEINTDKLEEIQQASQKGVLEAEINALYAQTQSYKAQIQEDLVDLTRITSKNFYVDNQQVYRQNKLTGQHGYVTRTARVAIADMFSLGAEDLQYTTNEASDIVDTFAKVRQVYKDNYNVIFNNNESLKNALLTMDKVPTVVKENINAIVKSKEAFDKVAKTVNEISPKIEGVIDNILLDAVQGKYGEKISKIATGEDGKVDAAKASQIELALTKVDAAKDSRSAIESGMNGISRESVQGVIPGMFNWELNDKEVLGEYAYNIKNDEDLAKTYAKEILKYTDEQIENLIYKNDQLNKGAFTDTEGNTVMNYIEDNEMRVRLKMLALQKKAQDEAESKLDQTDALSRIESLVAKGEEVGRKMGTDFSSAFLDTIINQDGQIDLSSLFTELSPSEVNKLSGMDASKLVEFFQFTEEDLATMNFKGENAAEEFLKAFQTGLEKYQWDKQASISSALNSLLTEEEKDYAEEIETYTKQIMSQTHKENDFADSLEEDAQMAAKVAVAIDRMNRGLQDLHDNIDDYVTSLKTANPMSESYAIAIKGIADSLGQTLGIDGKYLNTQFIVDNLEKIQKAADGDVASIESLRSLLASNLLDSWGSYFNLDTSQIQDAKSELESLQQFIDNNHFEIGLDFESDGILDDAETEVITKMNSIIQKFGLGVEEANSLFGLLGFEPVYEPVTIDDATGAELPRIISKTRVDRWLPNLEISQWTEQDGTESVSSSMTVGSLGVKTKDGQETQGVTPVVKSAKRISGGAQFLSKPTSKKGGSNKNSKMDPIKEDINRFHDIDIVLGDIKNSLEEVSNAQEKAFGKDLLEEYNKQLALLDKNISATEEKIKIANEWMEDLRNGNASRGIEVGLEAQGVVFDENGYITNYESIYRQKEQAINAMINKYNAMAEGDAKEKYKEDVIEPAQDEFETFKELFEKYEELKHETIPELLKNQEDDINKQIKTQIEKFNTEITIRLDLKDAEEDWNNFRRNVLEDLKDSDVLRNTELDLENFSLYYKDNENGIIQAGARQVNNILAELKSMDETGWSQVYGDNRVQALEDLKTYYDQLKEDLTDINTLIKDIQQSYITMMEEASGAFDEQVKTYKQISSLLEHDMKVVKLVNGEDSYAELDKYYEKLEKNNRKQLDFQKQEVEFWKNEMNSLDPIADEEAWEKARDNWTTAVNDLNSQLESSIETLQDKYLNAIEKIFDELNDKVTNGKGLDYISEEWDLLGQNSDEFLDEINALYGIEDIARKYQSAIDDTDNLTIQKKLKDIMEDELEALREKDKLTEYDIERAEKKYELTLKQIALEEAQQNKSQLRLRRDSQGNYTYQYVADEDEISKLQDEVAAAQNELYNFDLEQYKDKLEQVYDVYEEFQDKMKEAAQINDPEERAERELLLQQQYGELINGLIEQNEDIRNNLYESAFAELSALKQKELTDFTNLTQAEKDLLMNDLIPQWNSGIQEMVDVFAGDGGFIPTCSDAMEELNEATEEYEEELEQLEDAAGVNFDTIADGIDKTVRETQKLLEKNDELIDKYEEEMDSIGNLMDELDELIDKYAEAKEAAEEATEAAYTYWKTANEDAADEAKKDKYYQHEEEAFTSNTVEDEPSVAETSQGDGEISVGDTVTFIGGSGRWYADSFGGGKSGTSSSDRQVTITRINSNASATHPYHIDQLGWVKKSQLKGYDTGGYTGAWGEDGKLALLHQKELVLNAQDTKNMLNAVDILRDITNSIGETMLNRLAQISTGAKGILAGFGGDTLEQNVHIDATFPNVQSSNEIEEALKNLTNIAAQRAYHS